MSITIPTTTEGANQLMRRLCEVQLDLDRIVNDVKDAIQAAEKEGEKLSAPIAREKASLEAALKQFYQLTRKAHPEVRKLKLSCGEIFTAEKPQVEILTGFMLDGVIEALIGAGALGMQYVRIKRELAKRAIHEADDAERAWLLEHGVQVCGKPTVKVVPDVKKL